MRSGLGRRLLAACLFVLPASAQVVDYAGKQTELRLTPDAPVTGLLSPAGIAVDAQGNRYIVDPSLNNIVEVSATGVQSNLVTTGVTSIPGATAINYLNIEPGYLTVASSASGGTIYQVNLGTNVASTIGAGTSLGTITGLTLQFPNVFYATSSGVNKFNGTTTVPIALPGGANPVAVTSDIYGNVYITDSGNYNILKVPQGSTTAAVYASYGFVNGVSSPVGLTVDPGGNVYMSGNSSHVYQFTNSSTVHVLGIGFAEAYGLFADAHGNVYVSDYNGINSSLPAVQIIRPGAIDLGTANVCPTGGSGQAPCSQTATLNFNIDGSETVVNAVNAQLFTQGIASLDYTTTTLHDSCSGGNFFTTTTCQITVTFAPVAPGVRQGAIQLTANSGNQVVQVYLHGVGVAPLGTFNSGTISTIPFPFTPWAAVPKYIYGLAVRGDGAVYVSDASNCYVYKYAAGVQTTIAGNGTCTRTGDGGSSVGAGLSSPRFLAVDGRGNLLISDAPYVRKIDAITGVITTIAGGVSGYSADGVLASGAGVGNPLGIATDASGNVYVADSQYNTIRKIDATSGLLSTVVSQGDHSSAGFFSGDGGPATAARIFFPIGLTFDSASNLFFVDSTNNVIRRVDAGTGIITTVAGTVPGSYTAGTGPGNSGFAGDNGPASAALFSYPSGIKIDPAGDIYIADYGNHVVRKVDTAGTITTVAGAYNAANTSSTTYVGEGGPANLATLSRVRDVALDDSGDLYLTDRYNSLVLKVAAASTSVVFTPPLPVGTSSTATDVSFSNVGNAPLSFSALANPADFNLQGADTSCSTGTPLAAGASCVLGLEFLPTSAAALNETFTATNNTMNLPTSTQTVAESGTGLPVVAAKLVFVPASVAPLAPGGNLGTLTVDIEATSGAVAATATNTVSISITGPGGFTAGPFAGTVVNGVATFALGATALPTSGAYVVTATSSPALTPAVLNVAVSVPTQLAFTPPPPGGVIFGGNLGTVTLSVEDASNAVVAIALPLTATITDPNGVVTTINGNVTNASGTATYSTASQTFTTSGNYTIVVASAGLTSATANFTVAPAPATKLAISGVVPRVAVGGNLGTVTVTVENAANGVVTTANYPLTITITGPNGFSVSAMGTAVNGVAIVNVSGIVFTGTGTYSITSTTGDLDSFAPATFTVITAAPTKLALAGVAPTVAYGGSQGAVTIQVEDVNGVVAPITAPVTGTLNGPSGFTPVSFSVTASGGVASYNFSTLALSVPGTYTISVASPNLTAATATFVVSPAPATKLALSGVAATVVAGGNLGTVTVSVENAANGIVLGATTPITLTITGPNGFSATASGVTVNGVATINLSNIPYTAVGSYTITASAANLTSAAAPFTVVAVPTQLALAGVAATVPFGGSQGTVTVSVENAAGAVVAASTAPVTLSISGPGGVVQTFTVAAVNGVASFNLASVLYAPAGSYTVTATSGTLSAATASFTVTAAAPAQAALLAQTGLPATVTQGGNLGSAVAISIETSAGAVVTTSSAPVTITIVGPGGYSQTVTVAAVSGVARFDLSSLAFATLGNYTVTATSPGLTPLVYPFIVQQDFTLASSVGGTATQAAPPQTVLPGAAAVYPLVLAPAGVTFTAPITLTATGLPPGATYSFNPAIVTPGTAAATSTLTVTTATSAMLRPDRLRREPGRGFGAGKSSGLGAIAFAALLLPFGSRRLRKAARRLSFANLLLVLLTLGTLAGIAGCAAGGLYGHRPTSYLITVTGTSGAVSHSTTVTLVEQ